MQPTILLGGKLNDHQNYIVNNYSPKENFIINIEKEGRSIKIKQIHDLQKSISTMPHKNRIVWINNADSITTPAQNALLKILEEPPARTSFFLSTLNPSKLLPTIRSRCITHKIGNIELILNEKSLQLIKNAMAQSEGERIQIAKTLGKDRTTNIDWLNGSISSLQTKLRSTNNPQSLKILNSMLKLLLETKIKLESNCNVTLTIENFFLSLPKTK